MIKQEVLIRDTEDEVIGPSGDSKEDGSDEKGGGSSSDDSDKPEGGTSSDESKQGASSTTVNNTSNVTDQT